MDPIVAAQNLIDNSNQIVVLTGAGISTDSGIPDFRGPNGLWTQNPKAEKTATLSYYLNDPEVREIAWRGRLASPAWEAKPNVGHLSLVELEKRGTLRALITQNVDGLHQTAGNSPSLVIEVHGTLHWSICWECNDRRSMREVLKRVADGDLDPKCEICGGILKSDTISFGQNLVPEVIDSAMHAAQNCDLLIAIGSTLSVFPAANLVPLAKSAGAKVVIINGGPTGMDSQADVVINGQIGEILPTLITRTV